MGILMAFAVGYFAGGRAGGEGLDEVMAALKAVKESDEVEALLAALRAHAGFAFQELGKWLSAQPDQPINMHEALSRLRGMVRPDDATSAEF
jgi:hypothetical protein